MSSTGGPTESSRQPAGLNLDRPQRTKRGPKLARKSRESFYFNRIEIGFELTITNHAVSDCLSTQGLCAPGSGERTTTARPTGTSTRCRARATRSRSTAFHVLYKVFSVENIDGDGASLRGACLGRERLVDDEGAIVDPRARLEMQLEELRGVVAELGDKYECAEYDPCTGMEPSDHCWNEIKSPPPATRWTRSGTGSRRSSIRARRATFSSGFSDDPEIPLLYRPTTEASPVPAHPYHNPPSPDFAGGVKPSLQPRRTLHGARPRARLQPRLALHLVRVNVTFKFSECV